MSFNRTKYDNIAYNLQMQRSTGEGDYRLYAPYAENCNQCYSYDGPPGSKNDTSVVKPSMELGYQSLTDIESQLSWRGHQLDKSNKNYDINVSNKIINKPNCSNKLTTEDTRFTNPIDNYRSMSLTSLMMTPYLHVNPQCHIQDTCGKLGMNSRLYSKDSYKIPDQRFLDTGEAFPVELPLKNNKV